MKSTVALAFVCTLVLTYALPTDVHAGVVLGIDMDPNTDGIQTDLVQHSTPFAIEIYLSLDSMDLVSAYSFTVAYDSTELTAKFDGSTDHTPPQDFTAIKNPSAASAAGTVSRFAASYFDFSDGTYKDPVMGPGSHILGRIEFESVDPKDTETDVDVSILFATGDAITGHFTEVEGVRSEQNITSAVTLRSGSVSAVPEPASFTYLLGVVLLVRCMRCGWSTS